jgi:hypothetical protein
MLGDVLNFIGCHKLIEGGGEQEIAKINVHDTICEVEPHGTFKAATEILLAEQEYSAA